LKHQHISIFLADDDDDDRDFFKDAIKELGADFKLVMVDSGDKVIDHFNHKNPLPHFVFLDINMPVKNGIECLKFIKEKHPGNNFHVIMLSTSLADKDIKQSYNYGASIYIQKPGNFSHLVTYLEYCLHELDFSRDPDRFILNQRLSKLVG
jgi:DNA-binding response OmpR family regulator